MSYNSSTACPLRPGSWWWGGTGNDVAAALRNGAGHVDAVEIDPSIVRIGRERTRAPYDDPRVTVHVDDARSFFKKTPVRYDLIVLRRPRLAHARLDAVEHTDRQLRLHRRGFPGGPPLLADDGVLCVVFSAGRPFIASRLHRMMGDAFGRAPSCSRTRDRPPGRGRRGPHLHQRRGRGAWRGPWRPIPLAATLRASAFDPAADVVPAPTTGPTSTSGRHPTLHWIVMGVILLLGPGGGAPDAGGVGGIDPFYFCLGAAFLLVEVQTISRMACCSAPPGRQTRWRSPPSW